MTITVLAECDLWMHANAAYPLSLTLPHDKVGKDQDSLGLFQQRPRWWFEKREDSLDERVRTLMDARRSAKLFIRELVGVPNWESIEPWKASQLVQRSAFTDGSNYRARVAQANRILSGGPRYFTNGGT